MNKYEQAQVAILIEQMGQVYRNQLTPAVVDFYVQALNRFPFEAVQQVITTACCVKKYRPQPAELVEMLERSLYGGTSIDRAGQMFQRMIAGSLDTSPDYIVDDPRFGKALSLAFGSLAALGRSRQSDADLVKQFLNAYKDTFSNEQQDCLIKGVSRNPEPWLVYLGDWERCDAIAHSLLPQRKHYPRRPGEVKQLAHKQPEPQYVTKQEMEQVIAELLNRVLC